MLREHLLGKVALKYLNFARHKLGELYRRAKGGSLVSYYLMGDGTRIKVNVVGDDGYIRVSGQCPGLISGLAEALYPNHIVYINGHPALNRFYPRGGAAWEQNVKLGAVAGTLITKRPGLYSGEMRAVVQDNLGRALDIPYDFGWATTHGIYTAADGSKHVIEISAAGIYTWRLNTCPFSNGSKLATLNYIPLPSARPQEPTIIASSGVVSEAYTNYAPLFSECGWAFSANGHSAAIVAFRSEGSYWWSQLFTISITEVNNVPVSAAMGLGASGYVWLPKGFCELEVPHYGLNTLVTFDIDGNLPEPAATFTSPLYVWYAGSTLKMVEVKHDSGAVYVDDNGPIPSPDPEDWKDRLGEWHHWVYTNWGLNGFVSSAFGPERSGDREGYSDVYSQGDNIGLCTHALLGTNICATTYVIDHNGDYVQSEVVSQFHALVIPLDDREAAYHIAATSRVGLMGDLYDWSGAADGLAYFSEGEPFGCNTAIPPPWVNCGLQKSKTYGFYGGVVGGDIGQVEVRFFNECDPPEGFITPYIMNPLGIFTRSFSNTGLIQQTKTTYKGKLIAGAETLAITVGASQWSAWFRDASSEDPKIVIVVDDMSDRQDTLYSGAPIPDIASTIGATIIGGNGYPADELTRTQTAWVGNP